MQAVLPPCPAHERRATAGLPSTIRVTECAGGERRGIIAETWTQARKRPFVGKGLRFAGKGKGTAERET